MTIPTRSMCGGCTSAPKGSLCSTAADGQSALDEAVREKPD